MKADNDYWGNLINQFTLKGEIIPLSGISDGIMVRYDTFYLKIYNHGLLNAYVIEGYLWFTTKPKFVLSIPYEKFSEFAIQIVDDNYLNNPINITWEQPPLKPPGGADDIIKF